LLEGVRQRALPFGNLLKELFAKSSLRILKNLEKSLRYVFESS
jgi:hypothetical protein